MDSNLLATALGYSIWITPFTGVVLQLQNRKVFTKNEMEKRHIITLIVTYIILFITYYKSIVIGQADSLSSVFHISFLALIGTVLALEIINKYNNSYAVIVPIVLFIIPILGALRQYVYIVIPCMIYFAKKIKKRIYIIIIMLIIIYISYNTIVYQVKEIYKGTIYSNSSIEDYFTDASDPSEKNLEIRTKWWLSAAKATIEHNIIFGYVLDYRFNPGGYPNSSSAMLHNHFAAAFADGGLLLLGIILILYIYYLVCAIKQKDWTSVLVIYSYIIVMGVNCWATTGRPSYIAFYIYGYYLVKITENKKYNNSKKAAITKIKKR